MRTFFTCLVLFLTCSSLQAVPVTEQDKEVAWDTAVSMTAGLRLLEQGYSTLRLLAENAAETPPQPESGTLVIPGEEKEQEEKKCMNVCKKWGENCIINPRTGKRDCRRTCKEFGMECF